MKHVRIGNCLSGVLLLLLLSVNVMAQNAKLPTLDELIPGGKSFKTAQTIPGLKWWGDLCIKPEGTNLYAINPKNGKESVLLTLDQLNAGLKKAGEVEVKDLKFLSFPWNEKLVLIPSKDAYLIYDFEHATVVKKIAINSKAANFDFNANSNNLAYTVDNNLYVNDKQVTNEPYGIVCGQSVHRNEFNINKGTFWSPSGKLLAFYRMDESMVSEYPLVDITARVGKLEPVRYPMAGMTSHQVKVGIYNPENGKTLFLNAGDPTDRYFTNISWSPDEKHLYLIEVNRDQNHAQLCRYNAANGELEAVLLEEQHDKYVEPQHPIMFLPWDENQFIYMSQRDGYKHMYLYDKEGKELKQLTSGNWLVQDILGFDAQKKEVIFTSTEYSPLQSNIFRVNIKSGKRTPLGDDNGVHYPILSKSGAYLIDMYSSTETPRTIALLNSRNNKSVELLKGADPFEGYVMPSVEIGTIKAADGKTDLYYRIIKPADFDPNKKYPAIIYVYGGPHAQMITNTWNNDARGWDVYMANKGYILFTLDNRGSSNRGLEFENCTFRQLGVEEGKDQLKGVELLKSLPYVDGDRIGVHGWSFGGHMTTSLLLRYPEIFKVGVAGGPVIDWGYYEIMYGERYMDTPQSNPEGYEKCNLNNLAKNLKGHLLIIHDDHDATCVPQHTLSFMRACIKAGTYPDLFIYPCHEHNVRGIDRVHLHEKITRYFEDYL